MISALRHGLNSQVFRCVKYSSNKYFFPGLVGAINVISYRTIFDTERLSPCPKDPNILRIRSCQTTGTKRFSSPADSDKKTEGKYKWLLAVLAAGGVAGLMYVLQTSDDKNKKDSKGLKGVVLKARIPPTASEIPKEVPYLLIGGGTASFSAFRAIKSHDPKAKVLVVTSDFEKPYMRPPLSKELWLNPKPGEISPDYKFTQWNGAERSIYYEPKEFYTDPTKLLENPNGGVSIVQGYTVKKIDILDRKAILTDGTEISYGECLLATGCTPRSLSVFDVAPANIRAKVLTYGSIDDFVKLKKIADEKKSIAIVGGSFLGSELSCSLAKYGESKDLKMHQIFHESGNLAEILPEYLSKWTTEQIREQGVAVMPQSQVENVSLQNNMLKLDLSTGKSILVDHVVVCANGEPNTEIADLSGLEVDSKLGGIAVNAEMEARRHVYAAGDVASFYDPLLGRRRIEHHDHAVVSGRLAGENMTGLKKPFTHQSMFWSDLGPHIGYEGIGRIDSTLPTVGVFAKRESTEDDKKNKTIDSSKTTEKPSADSDDFGKGVVFYLHNEKIVGILLWNVFNRISIARKIINENKKYDDLNEVAKLFEIHS